MVPDHLTLFIIPHIPIRNLACSSYIHWVGEMAASGDALKKVAVVVAALCALLVLATAHGQLPPGAASCLNPCYVTCTKPVMDCVAACGGDFSCGDKCPAGRLSTCMYECNRRCFGTEP
ncbi:hypothetical protein ZWY2020_051541 [Hordeum vulgare]|nr:hypothetical protein ZWY2020_051541 [Hordeum vulgare]